MRTMAQLDEEIEFWTSKAARMVLMGEQETYEWEYNQCMEKIALFKRLKARREYQRYMLTKRNQSRSWKQTLVSWIRRIQERVKHVFR